MLPSSRVATHPGEILRSEFLEPLGLSQANLAKALGISQNRLNELVRGKRGITPETALLLAEYFGNSAEFWMNLQSSHDLTKARHGRKPVLPLKKHLRSLRRGAAGAD